MADRSLGVRLELITAFGAAAQSAVEELGKVRAGIEDLGKVNVQLGGLSDLAKQITNLNTRARSAAERVNAMTGAVNNAGTASSRASAGVEKMSGAAQKVAEQTSQATQKVLALTTSVTKLGEQSVIINSVGEAFAGTTAQAVRAKQAVDELDAALRRLPAAAPTLALGSGVRDSQGFVNNLPYGRAPMGVAPIAYALPGYAPAALPPGSMEWQGYAPRQTALPWSPYMLGPGQRDSQGFTYNLPPGREPIAPPTTLTRAAGAALGAGVTPMLTGGTDPYFDARKWWANWRANNPGGAGSGPPIGVPPGGFGAGGGGDAWKGWAKGGESLQKLGNEIQGMGWAAMVNGGMLGAGLLEAGKSAMNIADLLQRTMEALKASGVSDANAKKFTDATRQIAKDTGSDYMETVSAGYNFVSALPGDVQRRLNDPQVMNQVIDAYKRVAMMIVAGSASTHHITMEEGSLDANNVIANLGLQTGSPQQIAQAYKDSTNLLINLKNRTSTEVDMAAASIKAIGPVAKELGISPDEIAALIGMEAEGKVRGQQAGYAIKRILMRQMVPSGKTEKLLKFIDSHGGDLSIFDKSGKMRSLYDVMGDTNKFMDEHHLSQQERGFVIGQLSGLYAVPQEALLLDQMKRHAGDTWKDPQTGKVYHGAQAYGKSLIHGTIAGGKTGDAVTDSYHKRAENNPRIEAAKLSAHLQDAQFSFLKAAEPDILEFMHALTKLVDAFNSLPTPVKRAMVDLAAIGAITSVISGAFMIFGGNTIKLIGGMISFGGATAKAISALREGEQLTGALGMYQKVLGAVGGLARVAWSGIAAGAQLLAGGFMTVARSVGMAVIAMGPIGWTIAGLIAVGALLYEAWTHDWGGIREKTASVWNWIRDMFQKFPVVIISMLGPVGLALELVFNKGFRDKVVNGITGAINWLRGTGAMVGQALESWGASALHAGEAFIQNLGKGIQSAASKAGGLVKFALQKIRDLFPGSEPKDSSSPLYGMGKSGEAFSDMFIKGVIDGMIRGDKIKSGAKSHIKKPIMDTIIDLKGESVKEVEDMATQIAHALEKAGGNIKQQWMTLLSGGQATRFYGNRQSVTMAEHNLHRPDHAAQSARDYLDNLKRFPQSYEQIMQHLHGLILQSTTAHSMALINSMIAGVEKAHEAAIKKLDNYFLKGDKAHGQMGFNQLQTALANVSKEADKFDSIQQKADTTLSRQIDRRKNAEIPSLRELEAEQKIVADEQTKLNALYLDENNKLALLQQQRSGLLARIESLNGADKRQAALKQQLLAQLDQVNTAISTMNDRLEAQGDILTKVDGTLDTYDKKIKDAKKGIIDWEGAVTGAFTTAANTAIQNFADKIDNGVITMMQNATKRWSSSGSPIMQALSDFVNTFVDTLVKSIIDDVTKNVETSVANWFSKVASKIFGDTASSNGSSGASGAQDTAKQSALSKLMGDSVLSIGGKTKATVGDYAQGIGIGLAAGSMQGGTHAVWGAVGGAVGTTLGAIFGGPLGAQIGGAIGGAVGSLFGHTDDPNKMPDKYNTQAWGTTLANLVGAGFNGVPQWGANGQQFSEDATLRNQLGGKGLLSYISSWIAANPQQAIATLGQSVVSMFQGATNVVGGKDGNLTLNNGITANWQTLGTAAQNAAQAIQQLGNNALSSAQNADRLAASFTAMMLNGPAGFTMPLTLAGTYNGIGSTSSFVSTNPNAPGGSGNPIGGPVGPYGGTPQPQPLSVSILQGATITSDIAGELEKALPKLATTITAIVNRANYQQQRMYGNYVSATG